MKDSDAGGTGCERCEECYWFRPFPHFVRKAGGFCSHPAACRSVEPRLFLAEDEHTCRRAMPKAMAMGPARVGAGDGEA